jgi:uncharacterized membrane protein YdjX (TVP38/TMEM64 family)
MRTRVLWFALAIGALAAAAWVLPVADWLAELLRWIEAHRGSAGFLFVAAYLAACVLLVPGSLLTLAAGALFGLLHGVLLASVGSLAGATAAFLIGRTMAREWVHHRVDALPRFRALDRALAHDGFLVVLLTRLSPLIPFNLLNYAYGLTAVKLRDYVLGSWIGMLPATVLYVYLGTAAASLAQIARGELETGPGGQALFLVGLAATAAVAVLVTRVASRSLARELGDS